MDTSVVEGWLLQAAAVACGWPEDDGSPLSADLVVSEDQHECWLTSSHLLLLATVLGLRKDNDSGGETEANRDNHNLEQLRAPPLVLVDGEGRIMQPLNNRDAWSVYGKGWLSRGSTTLEVTLRGVDILEAATKIRLPTAFHRMDGVNIVHVRGCDTWVS